MSSEKIEKHNKILYLLIIISISFSFSISFYLSNPDFSLIGKSDREKLTELLPEYYELLFFAQDHVEPGATILFFEYKFYFYGQPLFYPIIYCKYLPYDHELITDQEVLEYLRNNIVHYILIFYIDFPFSENTTFFSKTLFEPTESNRYLLEINRSAL